MKIVPGTVVSTPMAEDVSVLQNPPLTKPAKLEPAIVDVSVPEGSGAPVTVLGKAEAPSLGDLAKLRTAGRESVHAKAREALSEAATEAATQTIAQHAPGAIVTGDHPLLEGFGETLGMALGVIVTEALALLPSWNQPLLDAQGQPVLHIEGADRIGDHDLRKRHQEVVGPKVTAHVQKLPPGILHELVEGLGRGATKAPGATYRLEVAVADALSKL